MDPASHHHHRITLACKIASGARHFKYWNNNIIPCVVVVVKKKMPPRHQVKKENSSRRKKCRDGERKNRQTVTWSWERLRSIHPRARQIQQQQLRPPTAALRHWRTAFARGQMVSVLGNKTFAKKIPFAQRMEKFLRGEKVVPPGGCTH